MRQRTPQQQKLDNAFLAAAELCHEKEMARLLAAGADPDVRAKWNSEPVICHIAMYGTPDELRLLIQYGVDVNAADAHGMTALHAALEQGALENADILIAQGAKLNAQARPGHTPPPWVTAILFDQKYPSTARTQFVLRHQPDFTLFFEHFSKPGQTIWDVLDTHDNRRHGAEIKKMVTEYMQDQHRRDTTALQAAQRLQKLKDRRNRDKGKYKL